MTYDFYTWYFIPKHKCYLYSTDVIVFEKKALKYVGWSIIEDDKERKIICELMRDPHDWAGARIIEKNPELSEDKLKRLMIISLMKKFEFK